ncbi:hypothetical protein BGX38DRAFT_1167794, partial [Terfezia claveryi]
MRRLMWIHTIGSATGVLQSTYSYTDITFHQNRLFNLHVEAVNPASLSKYLSYENSECLDCMPLTNSRNESSCQQNYQSATVD